MAEKKVTKKASTDSTDDIIADDALRKSEEKFRYFIESFQGIAYQTEKETHRSIFFYGTIKDITGYSPDDFSDGNVTWDKIVHPDDMPVLFGESAKLDSNPEHVANIEYRICRKDGEICWVNDISRIFVNEAGTSILQGAIYDITDRKLIEKKLRESEDLSRAIFESSTDDIIVWDRDYNVLYVNPPAMGHAGVVPEIVIGMNIHEVQADHPDVTPTWISRIDQVLKTGEPMKVENSITIGDETIFTDNSLFPLLGEDGNAFAVGIINRNITEHKKRIMYRRSFFTTWVSV